MFSLNVNQYIDPLVFIWYTHLKERKCAHVSQTTYISNVEQLLPSSWE